MSSGCGDDCQDALDKLEAFLDGELTDHSIGDISQHLAACYPCADRADFESQLRAIVKRGCAEQAPGVARGPHPAPPRRGEHRRRSLTAAPEVVRRGRRW